VIYAKIGPYTQELEDGKREGGVWVYVGLCRPFEQGREVVRELGFAQGGVDVWGTSSMSKICQSQIRRTIAGRTSLVLDPQRVREVLRGAFHDRPFVGALVERVGEGTRPDRRIGFGRHVASEVRERATRTTGRCRGPRAR
jgi:hypothetical protein